MPSIFTMFSFSLRKSGKGYVTSRSTKNLPPAPVVTQQRSKLVSPPVRFSWGLGITKAGSTGKWLEGCQIANMWTLIETRHDHLVYSCSCSSLLNSIVVELEILKVVPNLWLVLCVIPPFWFLFGATLSVWRAQKPQVKTLSSARSAIFAQAYQDEWIGMYKPSSWMAFVDTGFPSKWKGNVLYIYCNRLCFFVFQKECPRPKSVSFSLSSERGSRPDSATMRSKKRDFTAVLFSGKFAWLIP